MPPPVQLRVKLQLALALPHKATVLDGAAQLAVFTLFIPIADVGRVVGNHGVVFDFPIVAAAFFDSWVVLFGLVHDQEVKALA